ncbi:MAG: hypothetical protein AB7O80_10035 [Acetobacteraceae bacterium]
MDDDRPKTRTPPLAPGPTRRQDRLAREAEALRANLRRRKEQARARTQAADPPPGDKPNGES